MKSISEWKGSIELDGIHYDSVPIALDFDNLSNILLLTNKKVSAGQEAKAASGLYKVTVRQYMTKQANPSFDFMLKWNNDIPMPFRTMVGTIEKETPGMYKMNLHGDILAEKTMVCMKCGKPINNPVSQYFGMGPECGGHNYINPFESEDALKEAVSNYKKELQNKTWNGWIIKSAIIEMEEIKND